MAASTGIGSGAAGQWGWVGGWVGGRLKGLGGRTNIMCPGLTCPGETWSLDDAGGGEGWWMGGSLSCHAMLCCAVSCSAMLCSAVQVVLCCAVQAACFIYPPPLDHKLSPRPTLQVDEGAAVAIYAEGKEHAMAVGYTKMSTAQVGCDGVGCLSRSGPVWAKQA